MLQQEELEPLPLPEPVLVSKLDVLVQPRLHQVIELERETFPPCEQLGGILMQQQTNLRTSGLLIAELGATFAGYLLFSRTASSGLITKLAVAAPFQRRGIGSSLLRRSIEELETPSRRTAGVPEIMLHVDPARTGAQRLYEAFGFKRSALLPNYCARLSPARSQYAHALPHARVRGSQIPMRVMLFL
jgi:ribosomal protein S18 acetylase RimI-like enzyme